MNDRFNATPSRRKVFGLPLARATLFCFFVVTAGEAARAEDTVIGDPVFSLAYDNRNVHFDQPWRCS